MKKAGKTQLNTTQQHEREMYFFCYVFVGSLLFQLPSPWLSNTVISDILFSHAAQLKSEALYVLHNRTTLALSTIGATLDCLILSTFQDVSTLNVLMYRVIFITGTPQFQYQKENRQAANHGLS